MLVLLAVCSSCLLSCNSRLPKILVRDETAFSTPLTASSAAWLALLADEDATPCTAESSVLAMVVASVRLRLLALDALLLDRDATVVATEGTSTWKTCDTPCVADSSMVRKFASTFWCLIGHTVDSLTISSFASHTISSFASNTVSSFASHTISSFAKD